MAKDPRKLRQNALLLRRNASMPSITRDAAVPRYVMIPKTGTTALADFMNGCMHGRVSPLQVLDEADGTIIHKHIGPLSRDEHIVATLRDPVKRFSSLLNYREQKGKAQDKWLEMGLPLNANLSVVIDILTNAQMLQFSPYLTQSTYVTDCTVYTCSALETRDYFEKRMGVSRAALHFRTATPNGTRMDCRGPIRRQGYAASLPPISACGIGTAPTGSRAYGTPAAHRSIFRTISGS